MSVYIDDAPYASYNMQKHEFSETCIKQPLNFVISQDRWNALSREAITSAISLNAAITSDPAQSSQGAAAVRRM